MGRHDAVHTEWLKERVKELQAERDEWKRAARDAVKMAHRERERAKEAEDERDLACAEATRLAEENEDMLLRWPK